MMTAAARTAAALAVSLGWLRGLRRVHPVAHREERAARGHSDEEGRREADSHEGHLLGGGRGVVAEHLTRAVLVSAISGFLPVARVREAVHHRAARSRYVRVELRPLTALLLRSSRAPLGVT